MACWSPITLKQFDKYEGVLGKGSKSVMRTVPCGRCLGCLQRKRSDWSLRIAYEEKICLSSAFITLTYDEYNVPVTDNGNLSLDKQHLKDYFKRVRTPNMRFFACGEYGSKTLRPHYHAAVFNVSLDRLNSKWGKYKKEFGQVSFGQVNPASIHYLTKYIVNPEFEDWEDNHDTQKPFRLMSKGLGNGIQNEIRDYCNRNKSNIIRLPGGNPCVLPRYISDKVFSAETKAEIAEKAQKAFDRLPLQEFTELVDSRTAAYLINQQSSKSLKC